MKNKRCQYSQITGITLIALVVTIVILLILAGITINTFFSDDGIIKKSQIAKNEVEVSTIKEALQLYYLQQYVTTNEDNPIGEQFPSSQITDVNTLEAIVQFQSDAESVEQIHFKRLYYLDMNKLGISGITNEYFMDIETRVVYINNGIELNSGMTYVLEEREIFPVTLAVEQIVNGFKLIATSDENNEQISSYNFYINNELYKTVVTSEKTAQIEVTDKEFGNLPCYVRVNRSNGQNDKSLEVIAENYFIRNKTDMELFRDSVNNGNSYSGKTIKLLSDIDLQGSSSNRNWIPIGKSGSEFQGIFEGNHHKIKNLYNKDSSNDFQGLFGNTYLATIQNINIDNGEILGNNNCGGIIGYAQESTIINCRNSATIIASSGLCGGIVGYSVSGKVVENCSNTGNIESTGISGENGESYVGGIVGHATTTKINSCYNTGSITGKGAYVGGIVGVSEYQILNSYNSGTIVAKQSRSDGNIVIGGIVGIISNNYQLECKIENCYNSGEVTGNGNYVGGISGFSSGSQIKSCYNTSYISSSTGLVGGITGGSYLHETNKTEAIIENCYNIGKVEAVGVAGNDSVNSSIVGGIAGANNGDIIKSWNSGNIIVKNYIVGGIAGFSDKEINMCYNIGLIQSKESNMDNASFAGGIVGYSQTTNKISTCYNRGEILSLSYGASGIVGYCNIGSTVNNCYTTYLLKDYSLNTNPIVGNYDENSINITNCYYLGTTTSGEQRTEIDMKTPEFINLIGGSTYWKLDTGNINNGFVIFNWQ